jgi:hypothetical protein
LQAKLQEKGVPPQYIEIAFERVMDVALAM